MNFEPFGAMPKNFFKQFQIITFRFKNLHSNPNNHEMIKNPDCVLTHSYLPIQQEQRPWETKCRNYWTVKGQKFIIFQNLKNSFFGQKWLSVRPFYTGKIFFIIFLTFFRLRIAQFKKIKFLKKKFFFSIFFIFSNWTILSRKKVKKNDWKIFSCVKWSDT